MHLHNSTEPRKRQEQDMKRVQVAVANELPNLTIESYYASYDTMGNMAIEALTG